MSKALPKYSRFQTLKSRLDALHAKRFACAKKGEDVVDGEGRILYENILEEICDVMVQIKLSSKSPQDCNLFDRVLDRHWQKAFRENFQIFFIDRDRFEKPFRDYAFFNRKDLRVDKIGSDLCYAEGFALGFLLMLHKAQEMIARGNVAMDSAEFLSFFIELNAIVIGSEVGQNLTSREMGCGNPSQFLQATERKKIQDEFGENVMLYDFHSGHIRTVFSSKFDHAGCAKKFYEIFCETISKEAADIERAICDLMDSSASHNHLCKDGNNRAVILCGWLLAITHDISLPLLVNQFRVTESLVDEGRKWFASFIANPTIQVLSASSQALEARSRRDNIKDCDPGTIFLFDLIKQYDKQASLCLSVPLQHDDLLTIITRGNTFSSSIKLVDRQGIKILKRSAEDKVICARYLYAAIEEIPDLASEEEGKRNVVIATAFMKKICQNLDKLDKNDCALCQLVIAKYATCSDEFQKMVVQYSEACPTGRVEMSQCKDTAPLLSQGGFTGGVTHD